MVVYVSSLTYNSRSALGLEIYEAYAGNSWNRTTYLMNDKAVKTEHTPDPATDFAFRTYEVKYEEEACVS